MKDRVLEQFNFHFQRHRYGSAELWVLALLMVLFVGSLVQRELKAKPTPTASHTTQSADQLGVSELPGEERLPQSPAVGY